MASSFLHDLPIKCKFCHLPEGRPSQTARVEASPEGGNTANTSVNARVCMGTSRALALGLCVQLLESSPYTAVERSRGVLEQQ